MLKEILGKVKTWGRQLGKLHIPVYAANASFFVILAVFPALLLLLGLLQYTGLDVNRLADLLESFLPQALVPSAHRMILNTYYNSTGALLSVSAVVALWSAGRGLHGLMRGLNQVYGVEETRGFFATRGLSICYTLAFLAVLLLTLFLEIFESVFLLLQSQGVLGKFITEVLDWRGLVLLAIQTAVFTAMYVALPNRKNKIKTSIPGGLMASLGWMIFSRLYSVYMERFSSYSNIYGSVYGVALSMLWLFCCMNIVLYGGLLNRVLEERIKNKT